MGSLARAALAASSAAARAARHAIRYIVLPPQRGPDRPHRGAVGGHADAMEVMVILRATRRKLFNIAFIKNFVVYSWGRAWPISFPSRRTRSRRLWSWR